MSRMHFITRFVAYFPDSGDRGREELAHAASCVGATNCRLLRQAPYLLAVDSSAPIAPAGAADTLLDVFPGAAASARLAAANFDDAQSLEDVHRKAETFAQCYNLLQSADEEFLLESDALGLKPAYVARTPGGTILASRIADIMQFFPASAGPVDTAAVYELLGFWVPLAGRTLHRNIRRTLPGGCYRWTSTTEFRGERGRDLRPTGIEPQWFMDGVTAAIHDAASRSLREKTEGVPRPLLLALSGGFDSRFIAALCHEQRVDVRAVTYGRHHHSETRGAHAVAQTLGIDLRILPHLVDGTLRYLPQYLDVTEGTADPAGAAIMNLRRAATERGGAVLHGFCGDVQQGGRLNDFTAADYASRESIARAIMHYAFPASRPGLAGLFTPAVDLEEVREDILAGLRRDCPPYEAYLLWYLENRNRRYVAATCAMLGEHFDVVMPFYDRRLFDIWHSIPPVALAGRSVFRQLLARYYPALARIPHPEEAAPVTPNLRWQLARFYHQLPTRLLAACVGPRRADEIRLRLHRHHNFRSFGKLEAPQQRAYMLSEIGRLRQTLADGLGVQLSPGYAAVLAQDSQALRAVFGVARYADQRCGDSGSAVGGRGSASGVTQADAVDS